MSTEQQRVCADETRPIRALPSVHVIPSFLMTTSKEHQIPLVHKFSRLTRLLNTTARIRRLIPRFKGTRRDEVVTAEEKEWALELHIRQSQGNAFIFDINALKSRSRLDASSKILPLNPFLDEGGILRVGGRLTNADLPFELRHPIIFARDSALATLLIHDAHIQSLHGGIQEMLQFLRRKYWIIHSRTLVKSYIHTIA
ncbi:uncharacterized protein LOC118756624, partial [Rhagoletis pomonella]|uniref:uncharacterized protein LOC118756624 n=1 Tax=Rhagoletis pomonella TaxID=28610 RepID=UPI0017802632